MPSDAAFSQSALQLQARYHSDGRIYGIGKLGLHKLIDHEAPHPFRGGPYQSWKLTFQYCWDFYRRLGVTQLPCIRAADSPGMVLAHWSFNRP